MAVSQFVLTTNMRQQGSAAGVNKAVDLVEVAVLIRIGHVKRKPGWCKFE